MDGILFKVACPADDSPYLGSYEFSNKAAGHDLRGAITIFHAIEDENKNEAEEHVNLNCNLMAIIDHLGEHQTILNGGLRSGDLAHTLNVRLKHNRPKKMSFPFISLTSALLFSPP